MTTTVLTLTITGLAATSPAARGTGTRGGQNPFDPGHAHRRVDWRADADHLGVDAAARRSYGALAAAVSVVVALSLRSMAAGSTARGETHP